MITKADDSAHPQVYEHPIASGDYSGEFGLTKREYFAAMALQGYISAATNVDFPYPNPKSAATEAVRYADALIKELNYKDD